MTKEKRLRETIALQARHDYLTHSIQYHRAQAERTTKNALLKEHYQAQARQAQRELDALPCYID